MRKNKKSRITIGRDRILINNTLRRYLARLKGPRILRKAMEYAVFSGGKRLRPILAIESCRVLEGDIKKALPFACAIEFVHNFSLIHDDLPAMDNDDFRRGKPTCHKRFGEDLAILAGDALLNLAFGIILKSKEKMTLRVAFLLSEAIGVENMMGGQALDLQYERGLKKDRAFKSKIDRMKTAALMAISCSGGALAARAKKDAAERMYKFGMNLGLAFQIADDIRDSRHIRAFSERIEEAKSFISKGKKYLEPFKKRADMLRYIADSVLEKVK